MSRFAIAVAALALSAATARADGPTPIMTDRAREWVRACVPHVLANRGPSDAVRLCTLAAGLLFPGEVKP